MSAADAMFQKHTIYSQPLGTFILFGTALVHVEKATLPECFPTHKKLRVCVCCQDYVIGAHKG